MHIALYWFRLKTDEDVNWSEAFICSSTSESLNEHNVRINPVVTVSIFNSQVSKIGVDHEVHIAVLIFRQVSDESVP